MIEMKTEDLLDSFKDLLEREFDLDRDIINLDARLYEDLDLDSIDAVDLMAWMVKLTGKRLSPDDFKNVRTVGDVIQEIEKQLS